MRRLPAIVLIAILVLGISAWSIQRQQTRRQVGEPAAPPAPSGSIAATGVVEPHGRTRRLQAPVDGLVARILVAVGDRVSAGQPVIALDDRVATARVHAAEADVARLRALPRREDLLAARAGAAAAAARARAAEARRDEARSLAPGGVLSAVEIDQRERGAEAAIAEAERAAAEAAKVAAGAWPPDLVVAEATLARARAELAELTIVAPQDGTVLRIDARPGERAIAADGRPLLVMGDISRWQVRAAIDEEMLPRLMAGSATAQVRGLGGRRVELRWAQQELLVLPKTTLTGAAAERTDTRVLEVVLDVADPGPGLVAGQVVDVVWGGP